MNCKRCGKELEYEYDEYQAALTGNGLIDPGDLCSHCETVEEDE